MHLVAELEGSQVLLVVAFKRDPLVQRVDYDAELSRPLILGQPHHLELRDSDCGCHYVVLSIGSF